MASFVYNNAKAKFIDGTLQWNSGQVFKAMLVTSGYVANPDHVYVSEVTPASYELTGTTGYESTYVRGYGGSGRKTLANKTVAVNTTLDRAEVNASAVSWPGINTGAMAITAVIIIREIGSDGTSLLVAYLDSAAFSSFPLTTNGADVTVTFDSTGIFRLS